ncbi:MAG: lipase family protein [Pseudanabaena sp. ELA607]|jgi:triacylglycerol lipase
MEFDAQTTKYSASNAYLAALCAQLAYKNEGEIKDEIKKQIPNWELNENNFHFFDRVETQGFIMGNDEMIVLAFRGTEPSKIQDWLTDLQFMQCKGPSGVNVHSGFYEGLLVVWEAVKDKITELRQQEQSILLTGHSLGAALATLATAQLKEDMDIIANGLYTFGSPRVGGKDFREYFNNSFADRAFRLVNNNDAVTRFPPRINGYAHTGQFLYFDTDGDLHQEISFWDEFKESVKGIAEDVGKIGLDMIKDHDMEKYKNYVLQN